MDMFYILINYPKNQEDLASLSQSDVGIDILFEVKERISF